MGARLEGLHQLGEIFRRAQLQIVRRMALEALEACDEAGVNAVQVREVRIEQHPMPAHEQGSEP
jgi:hypothetical protein